MGWLWVAAATWLLLAALSALLVGRAIREDDHSAKAGSPSESSPGVAPPVR
jgi:hypothetical protein